MKLKDLDRLATKYIIDASGCWLWTRSLDKDGYGQFYLERKMKKPHRLMYELIVSKIPDGLVIDHLCKVRHCVNPKHLEPVTNKENVLRSDGFAAVNSKKTHCPKNHEYTTENTYLDKSNMRHCRECGREYMRKYAKRKGNKD